APNIPVVHANPGKGSIAVIGDSLARGFGATDAKVTPTGCLDEALPGTVTNLAEDGATSKSLEQKLPNILMRKDKMVVVSAGYNDALAEYLGNTYKVSDTLASMARIFDSL